jgi:hypothetical protein
MMAKVLIAGAGYSHSLLRALIDVLTTQDITVTVVDKNGESPTAENIFPIFQINDEDREFPKNIFLPQTERLWLKENERGTRSKKKSKGVARKNLSRRHSVTRGK